MPKTSDLSTDINFLFEMGNIRFIARTWSRFLHSDLSNLAEHHFRVFWIAMIIAAREQNVDTGKLAKLCLLHDIAESRTGDVDYLSRQYVERNEELGIKDMLAGTPIEEEFLALWREYEDRETLEARIAKDADNIDVDLELAEQEANGSQLKRSLMVARARVAESKLYTETARELYRQIQNSDPHAWHMLGRNRHTSGDWKK
jgi:putative hydrolase of HD superfamily